MKKIGIEKTGENLKEFALSIEEMIYIKGGDAGEPIYKPGPPPVQV